MKEGKEKDRFYLGTILDALDGIALHQKSALPDYTVNRAVILEIMTVGEAATKISAETKNRYPQIAWTQIAGTRHKIVHEYFQIDPEIIENIVENHLPDLRHHVESILKDLGS